MLHELAKDIWIETRPERFWGLEVGCRMTVVRLDDGSLWLHSAVEIDPALGEELDALGPVRYVVAPNRFHHLYAGEVKHSYPASRLWIGAGIREKRPDLGAATVLTDDAPSEWNGQIDQCYFRGRPLENEVTFLHRASRTLLLCDLAFHFGPRAPLLTRLVTRIIGGYGRFRPSRLDPFLIRDRVAARRSLDHILSWDFDRVVVAHGEVLGRGGREALRAGYAWL